MANTLIVFVMLMGYIRIYSILPLQLLKLSANIKSTFVTLFKLWHTTILKTTHITTMAAAT
ncbi:hypothetical protein [Pontibacter pudoricolor]|uniref:hypothetical protein n=1 Tax=Pontibacter pudoricolor TaxID=2694930 RepID=UPI001390FDC3|nr:hypothetical protein [Pontibacter pudoricolor]